MFNFERRIDPENEEHVGKQRSQTMWCSCTEENYTDNNDTFKAIIAVLLYIYRMLVEIYQFPRQALTSLNVLLMNSYFLSVFIFFMKVHLEKSVEQTDFS